MFVLSGNSFLHDLLTYLREKIVCPFLSFSRLNEPKSNGTKVIPKEIRKQRSLKNISRMCHDATRKRLDKEVFGSDREAVECNVCPYRRFRQALFRCRILCKYENGKSISPKANRKISVCGGDVKKEEDESSLGNYKTCNFRCPLIAFEVERKTGLEPATLTLARLCSTN